MVVFEDVSRENRAKFYLGYLPEDHPDFKKLVDEQNRLMETAPASTGDNNKYFLP